MNNISAGVFFYAKNTQRFLYLLRTDNKNPGNWGIPGGKIEWGESSEAALRREILEETGLRVRDVSFVMAQDSIFSKEFYREAHFVLLNYTCQVDSEGGQQVLLNSEAQEFCWIELGSAWELDLNQATRALLRALLGEGGKGQPPKSGPELGV